MPAPNFSGPVTFTYRATDGTSLSNVATVTILVNPVNDPPVAVNDSYGAFTGIPLVVPAGTGILANDTDIDSSPLTVVAGSVTGPAHGTVTVNPDGSFTYTATPGYTGPDSFTYKATDGSAASNVATVSLNVTQNPTKVLTVTRSGAGSGVVTGTGINCGADCTETYANGQSVTLTPTPAAGSYFAGWSGACTGTGACSVNMTDNRSVNARFELLRTLTVLKAGLGSGTVTGVGIACGTDCTESYSTTSPTVTLTVVASPDSVFMGWSGACTGTGTCTVSMTESREVTAIFYPGSTTGRMTGGGNFPSSVGKVTHGFTLQCNVNDKKANKNLEVNWDGGNNFKLGDMTSVVCYDDPAIYQQQPQAGFDTMVGTATGTLNGKPATIEFKFQDAGEPGTSDTTAVVIRQNGAIVLNVGGVLNTGNHQAHKN